MRNFSPTFIAVLVAAMNLPLFGLATASESTCTGSGGTGGDWAMYGHDLEGTRHQTEEDQIAPETVGALRPHWVIPAGANNSTPIVAGRCVYVAGAALLSGGEPAVSAYDLDDGSLVWQTQVRDEDGQPGISMHAVAVVDGRVHVNFTVGNRVGRAAAFDANTGAQRWMSEAIEFGYPADVISSAMIFEGVHWLETYGPDGDPRARPGYALFDAETGETLYKGTTIPVEDLDRGYAGGGMWGTPVFDTENGYMFNGTANPYSHQREHAYDNALIKIDASRARETFGDVVDHYKGSPDSYILPRLEDTSVCEQFQNTTFIDPACMHLDLDFVSPTLFRNDDGELLVGAIQRDGNYHVANAATMESEWKTPVSHVDVNGNEAAGANDGERVYVATNRGPLFALNVDDGSIAWVSYAPVAQAYGPVSIANDVLFVPGVGSVTAYDASNGVPLWHASLWADGGDACANLGGGVAIAHHTVLVNCDGGPILAYRLDPGASPIPLGSAP